MSAVDVHAVVSGRPDAPAVVLSNSLGSTHRMWDHQVDALEEHFRMIRYDTRGHGASPVPAGPYSIDDLADDVVALLDRLGVPRAHVVGLSLGGMTAMRLAARNPGRVDRLAVLCTAAHLPPRQAWLDRAAAVREQGAASIAETVVQRWFTRNYDGDLGYWQSMIAATPAVGYAACCAAIAELDLREQLSSISAPTLAIAGADDPATPPAKLQEIVAGVPDSGLVVLDQAAHLANVEQPDAVTRALLEHLTGSGQRPA